MSSEWHSLSVRNKKDNVAYIGDRTRRSYRDRSMLSFDPSIGLESLGHPRPRALRSVFRNVPVDITSQPPASRASLASVKGSVASRQKGNSRDVGATAY